MINIISRQTGKNGTYEDVGPDVRVYQELLVKSRRHILLEIHT